MFGEKMDAICLMRIPDALSYVEAAAIPNVFITAHDALASNALLSKGESVLVTAAASGIGTATIQLAKHFDAGKVIASTRDADKMTMRLPPRFPLPGMVQRFLRTPPVPPVPRMTSPASGCILRNACSAA